MSADNYYLIRKHPEGYLVTCEFASDSRTETLDEVLDRYAEQERKLPLFATLAEAQEYAYGEYSEYGVSYAFPTETVEL